MKRRRSVGVRRAARIELLCIGTELLSGRLNTHQRYLSLELLAVGLGLHRESTLPDDRRLIASEMRRALGRSDVVLVSGGLGPTFDDITREAAAAALGRSLTYRPALFADIRKKFARYRLPVPEGNKRQAFVIGGARVLRNPLGSAPGQMIGLSRRGGGHPRTLVLMPGPPKELSAMFESAVLPHLKRLYGRGRHSASMVLHLSGIPESSADELLKPVMAAAPSGMDFTILASLGQVDFHVRAVAPTLRKAKALIAHLRAMAKRAVRRHIVGEGPNRIESAVGRRLKARGLTLAVAESCTGGMLGTRLTGVSGSSDYFKGGVLSYADDLKSRMLGVRRGTLSRHGAVSVRCAEEMAAGVRTSCRSDVGISITGIAGPGGGTRDKPVGLVFIAISGPGPARGRWRLKLPGDREAVRQRASSAALHLLWRHLGTKRRGAD